MLGLLALIVGWVVLSLVLFLLSSHFRRVSPPANVAGQLEPAGFLLTSANNILVLGSDKRQKDSKEPGADTNGPSRSDSIMLIRTGGGHAARLSIPRDTVIEIPGHGLQKINAAYAFGGPAESISVIKHYLGVPINHVIEVNFENFPELVDAMGGITYTGGCVVSYLDGGSADGGFTLRLSAGTHHLDGREALALARTRENRCAPQQTDLQREERQQKLLLDMKSQLLSFSSFLRLPLISWNAPPTIISDMSGPELLTLFGGAGDRRHAPDAPADTHRSDHAARRRRRPHGLRKRRTPRRGGAVHGGVAAAAQPGTASAAHAARARVALAEAGRLLRALGSACSPRSSPCRWRRSPSCPPKLESDDEESEAEVEELSAAAAFSRWRLRVP